MPVQFLIATVRLYWLSEPGIMFVGNSFTWTADRVSVTCIVEFNRIQKLYHVSKIHRQYSLSAKDNNFSFLLNSTTECDDITSSLILYQCFGCFHLACTAFNTPYLVIKILKKIFKASRIICKVSNK